MKSRTRTPNLVTLLLPTFALVACSESGSDRGSSAGADGTVTPIPALRIVQQPSPAGEGSVTPHLAASEDGVELSWLEEGADGVHSLRYARLREGTWSEARTVATRDDFLVNWADFPAVARVGDRLLAHWLQRSEGGPYAYGVRLSYSTDDGVTWSAPVIPHEDDSPTEHGFVSSFAHPGGGIGTLWLDGRAFVEGVDGSAPTHEMALRYRRLRPDGTFDPEGLISARTCDCCPTDVASTEGGAVAVYRGRTEDEVRDIMVTRLVDGAWTVGAPVHADGWRIEGCPVNGPAVDARGEEVVVVWFTAEGDEPRVQVAFSFDGGVTFDEPVRADAGNPVGRADVVITADGAVWVSWLEQLGQGEAALQLRRVYRDGSRSEASSVAATSASRASGMPQMVAMGNELVFAWTEVEESGTRIRMARTETKP